MVTFSFESDADRDGLSRIGPMADSNAADRRAKQSRNSASRMRIDKLPAGAFLAVDRDPCPRCGTRRDLGCRHTASALRTRFSQEHVHG